jgi:universal stress protein A
MITKFCESRLAGFSNYASSIETGTPFREIIRMADKTAASMIVLGTHGRSGLGRLVFGSTAERVVRVAHCPVLTVPMP